jgi:hypothetical protein
MLAGAAAGGIGSGSWQGAWQGALSGALFYGAGSFAGNQGWAEGSIGRAAAHAVAGCISASAAGGSCGSGALSAGFAEGVGGRLKFDSFAANLTTRMVIGGTASVLGGGEFANGAKTAAFGYLFNELAHLTTMEQRGYPTTRHEKFQWDLDKLLGPSSITADGCIQTGGPALCFTPAAIEGVGVKLVGALSAEGKALLTANPIGSALKGDSAHLAATFMREEAAVNGTHFAITGGDGVTRTLTQVPGGLNGIAGRYEYIVDSLNNLTHQMFVRGGSINGIPIKP